MLYVGNENALQKTMEILAIKQNRKISGKVDKFGIELVTNIYI